MNILILNLHFPLGRTDLYGVSWINGRGGWWVGGEGGGGTSANPPFQLKSNKKYMKHWNFMFLSTQVLYTDNIIQGKYDVWFDRAS